ncbi:hypothetical protein D5F01_LYC15177 [Larimichthys crocea]|uniref:Uncharacterized protein n=1 Tax=Larimichthys crocea TaxID=215358 RepID=A0A6G0I6P6_LARCR|nr:hypothetical protein D5F01_LYC15177 [Larimichthys crocea]
MATLDNFISAPSEELLEQFTKDQLLQLASYYEFEITSSEKCLKESVKEALKAMLIEKESDPSNRQPVKIWRDSGAFQSLILKDVLQFTEESALGSSVLVEGFGEGYLSCPLYNLDLQTALVSGKVVVAICPYLPIDGVSFILGNDLAGGRVLTAPEVVSFPVAIKSPDELEEKFPEFSLSDTFLVKLETTGCGKVFPSREELKLEQGKDATLSNCFGEAISEDELNH